MIRWISTVLLETPPLQNRHFLMSGFTAFSIVLAGVIAPLAHTDPCGFLHQHTYTPFQIRLVLGNLMDGYINLVISHRGAPDNFRTDGHRQPSTTTTPVLLHYLDFIQCQLCAPSAHSSVLCCGLCYDCKGSEGITRYSSTCVSHFHVDNCSFSP